jgi:hypothetical protein
MHKRAVPGKALQHKASVERRHAIREPSQAGVLPASRSRSTCSARKRSSMSAKATTAPRPSDISIGTET